MPAHLFRIGNPFLKVIQWLDGLYGGCYVAEKYISCIRHCHCWYWAPETAACFGQCPNFDPEIEAHLEYFHNLTVTRAVNLRHSRHSNEDGLQGMRVSLSLLSV